MTRAIRMDLSSVFAVCLVKEGSKRPLFELEVYLVVISKISYVTLVSSCLVNHA